jgi:hypothetical protein
MTLEVSKRLPDNRPRLHKRRRGRVLPRDTQVKVRRFLRINCNSW